MPDLRIDSNRSASLAEWATQNAVAAPKQNATALGSPARGTKDEIDLQKSNGREAREKVLDAQNKAQQEEARNAQQARKDDGFWGKIGSFFGALAGGGIGTLLGGPIMAIFGGLLGSSVGGVTGGTRNTHASSESQKELSDAKRELADADAELEKKMKELEEKQAAERSPSARERIEQQRSMGDLLEVTRK